MIGERRNVLLVLAGSAVLMTLCSQTQELAQELTGSRKGELTRNLAAKLIEGSEQFAGYTKNIAFHRTGFQKGIEQRVWDRNRRLTARGTEVFESVSPGGIFGGGVALVLKHPATTRVNVTGIADVMMGTGIKEAHFEWRYLDLPSLAKRFVVKGGSGKAYIRRYDDGWATGPYF